MRTVRIIIHKPDNWDFGNLFGTIISERANSLKIKLSKRLDGVNFSSDLIEFISKDSKSFNPLSQYYAVYVDGYIINEKDCKSEYILSGTISYD